MTRKRANYYPRLRYLASVFRRYSARSADTRGDSSAQSACKSSSRSNSVSHKKIPLLQALNRGIQNGWTQSAADSDPNILFKALQSLADPPAFAGQSDRGNAWWLRRRAKAYLHGHLADPVPWPPPAAVDWLWVDPGNPNVDDMPQIEAPEFAAPPL